MSQSNLTQTEAIESRLARIESELAAIQARNARVEDEKAWEVSLARRSTVAAMTYIFASILLWALGNDPFFLSALVPTAGYLLSTLTLPWAKERWFASHSDSSSFF